MGRQLRVVNMETSLCFLFCILILFAVTEAARNETESAVDGKHNTQGLCDPENPKSCTAKSSQRCEDDDGDGHWYCSCIDKYETMSDDGFCRLDECSVYGTDNDGEYKTIDKQCFYFEQKKSSNFVEAHESCKSKFNGKGRLFEPKNEDSNNAVVNVAQSLSSGEAHWIGIRSRPHLENSHKDFYYVTKGPGSIESKDTKSLWASGLPHNNGVGEDCVSVLKFSGSGLKWNHIDCDEDILAICELNVEQACGKPLNTNDIFCDDDNNNAGCNWDGGACCNRLDGDDDYQVYKWDEFCDKKNGCKCLDPNSRAKGVCKDSKPATCKKCKGNKCKKDKKCQKNCKKTCNLCPE